MTIKSTIKNWFKTGQIPTQAQFWALFDSFWHKSEVIPVDKIDGLQGLLDVKLDEAIMESHKTDPNAHLELFNVIKSASKFKEATTELDIYTNVKVGIGTDTPISKLDVIGDISVSSDAGTGAIISTKKNEPIYINSLHPDNNANLLLNVNGTAELTNSNIQSIKSRGNKAIITREYIDSISGQIISDFIPQFNLKIEKNEMYSRYASDSDLRIIKIIDDKRCLFSNFMTSDEMLYLRNYDIRDFYYNKITKDNIAFTVTSGTVNSSNSINAYVSMGGEITTTFTGTHLQFNSFKDTRGAIWEFTLNDDLSTKIQVDTYQASGAVNRGVKLWENLENKIHTVVGKVIGFNPLSTEGNNSRGWISNSTSSNDNSKGFSVLEIDPNNPITVTSNNVLKMLSEGSVEEFAFRINLPGELPHWIPNHGDFPMQNNQLKILRDNVIISSGASVYTKHKEFKIIQKMDAFYVKSGINQGNAIAKVDCIWNFKNEFFEVYCKIKALREFDINTGYVMMIPFSSSFATKAVDNNLKEYDLTIADGSQPTIENITSVYATNDNSDLVSVATMVNSRLSMKDNMNSNTSIQYRTSDVKKFYFNAVDVPITTEIGDEFIINTKYFAGLK